MPIMILFWLLLSFLIGAISSRRQILSHHHGQERKDALPFETDCRALLANVRDMSSPANHCPCLPIHLKENTEKEEMYLLKEQYQPTNWHSDRTYTEYISVRNFLTPRHWDFAVNSLRFSQSKCFAILTKKSSWHLEGMIPSGLWDGRRWDLLTWLAVLSLYCSLPSRIFPLCSSSYSAFLNLLILKWVSILHCVYN